MRPPCSEAAEIPDWARRAGCPARPPFAAAADLGLTIERSDAASRIGGALLVACLEGRTITLYEEGVRSVAERRGESLERVADEAVAHEVLHFALRGEGARASETAVRRLAGAWASGASE